MRKVIKGFVIGLAVLCALAAIGSYSGGGDKPSQGDGSWKVTANDGWADVAVESVTDNGVTLRYTNNSGNDELTELVNDVVVGEQRYSVLSGDAIMTVDGNQTSSVTIASGESKSATYSVPGMTQDDYGQGVGIRFDETAVTTRHDTSGAAYQDTYRLQDIGLRVEKR